MSLEWPGSTSDVLPALVSRTAPSDAASTTQNRQFKHFIVTVDDERFRLNRKRIKRNRVRVACLSVLPILYHLLLLTKDTVSVVPGRSNAAVVVLFAKVGIDSVVY
jgi:hypothetical protein